MGVGGQHHAPAALPSGKDPVPIVQEAGWAPGRVRKISPPPGFDPRTVQTVASRYTDWAITAHKLCCLVGGNSGTQTEGTRLESRLKERISCISSSGNIVYLCFNL